MMQDDDGNESRIYEAVLIAEWGDFCEEEMLQWLERANAAGGGCKRS